MLGRKSSKPLMLNLLDYSCILTHLTLLIVYEVDTILCFPHFIDRKHREAHSSMKWQTQPSNPEPGLFYITLFSLICGCGVLKGHTRF